MKNKSVEQVVRDLKTRLDEGLSKEEAKNRLEKFGLNEIRTEGTRSAWRILFHQLANPMSLLLLAVIGISITLGHFTDALIIGGIVLLNTGVAFFQEFRAEKAMESIRRMATPEAKVLRSGQIAKISARELVPGDIVLLEAGDRIPADLRFSEAAVLKIDESLLTGESIPVFKETALLQKSELSLGDQSNIGFMGTHVVAGRGVGICIATGPSTELGRIAHLVSSEKAGEVPLKKRMDQLTRQLVFVAFFLCLATFVLGSLYQESVIEVLMAAITLAIAALPEGLPVVITISLSLGALSLARRGVLVRRLQAVEALGSITTICADKTGTLTLNRMEVKSVYPSQPVANFFHALVLCNDAQSTQGDPMEIALLQFAAEKKIDSSKLRAQWKRLSETPFDTDRKRMSTVHESNGRQILFLKGAPEVVLSLCLQEISDQGITDLSKDRRREIHQIIEKLASEGLRILAVAMKEPLKDSPTESDMTFLGLVGIQDPPRAEAKTAIAECRSAGIRPVMMTGDHPATAIAIGRQLGLYQEGDQIITGSDLNREGKSLLDQKAAHTTIFARVSPEDKLKIVEVLKDNQELVAMTGDGINDAPALKKADIGIAMGRGTDVAKEASSLILVEENFSTIVRAIHEGRVIYDNIRKFVRYMLTTNLGEIATMLLAMSFTLPLPLLPVQILWINLVTDGLPAVALGFEPAEGNVMARPPRHTNENILGKGLWQHAFGIGIFMGIIAIGLMGFLMKQGHEIPFIRTMIFTTLVLAQMAHVLAIRSETQSFWKIGLFSNYRLIVAVAITILAQILLISLKPLQSIFHTHPLSGTQFLLCCALASLIFIAVEIEKSFRRHHYEYRTRALT